MEKIFIKTFGCSQNCADSEILAGFLKKAGFNIVKSEDESDLVIINSCTVKQPTENNFFKYLESVEEKNKKIVISGCLPKTSPKKVKGYSLIGPNQLHSIVEVVEETLSGNTVTLLVDDMQHKLAFPRIRKQSHIEIIPISNGCLGDCAYCIVRFARGKLISYPRELIIGRVRKAVSQGINQIWITSQDTGCYGMDNESNYLLPNLLKDICKLPGDFKVRVGMMNPNHVLKYLDDLIEAFKSKKLYRFIHIPVQSGNDEVLKNMRRKYTVKEFNDIAQRIRSVYPDMTIATDIICGFPGEQWGQFMDSIKILKDNQIDVANRSRFWTRPGTEAEKMKCQVHSKETKERSRFLINQYERISYERNKYWNGWEGEIFIESKGLEGSYVGRNYAYKPIIVEGEFRLGQKLNVKIMRSTIFDLRAIVKN